MKVCAGANASIQAERRCSITRQGDTDCDIYQECKVEFAARKQERAQHAIIHDQGTQIAAYQECTNIIGISAHEHHLSLSLSLSHTHTHTHSCMFVYMCVALSRQCRRVSMAGRRNCVLSALACVEGTRAAHMNAEAVGSGFGV